MAGITGHLFIDGNDAATSGMGIYLLDGELAKVVQMPSLKAVDTNDWAEDNGIEVDLSAPVLASKTFSLKFHAPDWSSLHQVRRVLSNGAYHQFRFALLGRTYNLRLTSFGTPTLWGSSDSRQAAQVSLSFAEDNPTLPTMPSNMPFTTDAAPLPLQYCEIDTIDLSRFGVARTTGTMQQMLSPFAVRDNLTVNLSTVSGVVYDSERVRLKQHEVKWSMLIHTTTIADFWQRWDALFATLLQSGTRRLTWYKLHGNIRNHEYSYNGYYQSCAVKKFLLRDYAVWCEFDITFTLTDYLTL